MALTPVRSLADQLRQWPESKLAALLQGRPDLATPAPQDSSQLASRAATRSSLLRALDQLTQAELLVLDALLSIGQTTPEQLLDLVYADPSFTRTAITRLCDLAVVWEGEQGLRPLTGTADAMRGLGTGLQPFTGRLDIAEATGRIETLTTQAQALLSHLDSTGGEGHTQARRNVALAEAKTPVEELLALDLLTPTQDLVVIPGEVAIALRGGHTTREPIDAVPSLSLSTRDQTMIDRVAAGAGFEAIRRLEQLLDSWGQTPPAPLRTGGLGVRDLRQAAAEIESDEATAALLIELAAADGLIAVGNTPDGMPGWLPTHAFDTWTETPVAQRWVRLVGTWLHLDRLVGLVGSRVADKPVNVLVPELTAALAAETRQHVLRLLTEQPTGTVLATGTGAPALVERVRWERPRRPSPRDEHITWTLREAATLGLLGLGGLSTAARALLTDADDAAELLAPLLPSSVDHVLLQADLTAVAPGPLETEIARRLALLAEVDSRGGATVFRFTPGSVRRAFDAGWAATEIHDFLTEVSTTPVPQPLSYLVDDTARTFGVLRVAAVEAVIRSDDETALSELLQDPKAAGLELRRIAPTVVISTLPLELLLPQLRDLGRAPVVEASDGTVHVRRHEAHRTRAPRRTPPQAVAEARSTSSINAAVRAIRAGDKVAAERPERPQALTPSGALSRLREAIETDREVLIKYVGNQGTATERIVVPIRVDGGTLTAEDRRTETTLRFAVHRITSVSLL